MSRAKTIFEGRVISLHEETHRLPDGREADFEIVRHPGGAAVLPILPDGKVILIRQFRPAIAQMVWEIPAGRLEPGEAPETCGDREIIEEVGYRAGRLEKLGEMWTAVGFCDELLYIYTATELEPVPRALEEDEYIEIVPMSTEEALGMVLRGEIRDGKTQLALLLWHKQVKERSR